MAESSIIAECSILEQRKVLVMAESRLRADCSILDL